jgi:hypothetical protein
MIIILYSWDVFESEVLDLRVRKRIEILHEGKKEEKTPTLFVLRLEMSTWPEGVQCPQFFLMDWMKKLESPFLFFRVWYNGFQDPMSRSHIVLDRTVSFLATAADRR